MTVDEKTSDLVMKRDECPKCSAIWLNNRHMWATGSKGDELDLAGLICNKVNSPECINPKKGIEGGDTWADRFQFIGIELDQARKAAAEE